MRVVVLDPPSAGLDEVLERRRRSGLDRLDEVWEGVLHMVPAPSFEHAEIATQLTLLLAPRARQAGLTIAMHEFNVGESDNDYRIPDGGLHRGRPRGVWHSTAALLVEIVSPGDETWDKLPFYAAHDVDELLIVDPQERTVRWLALRQGTYESVQSSGLIECGSVELAGLIDWPPVDA